MSSLKKRRELREKEVIDRVAGTDYEYKEYGPFRDYVLYGGKPTPDDICKKIEMDIFLGKHTNYKTLRNEYGYGKMPNDIEDEMKYKAITNYVMENRDNIHKILNEIPWSLKNDIDIIYKTLY